MCAFVCRCGSDRGSFLSLLGDGIESEARYWCVVVTLLVRMCWQCMAKTSEIKSTLS
jgi:hypothetical protein